MISRVYSAAIQGVEATMVEVEVASRSADELKTIVVGLPDTAVRESVERVHFALQAAGLYQAPCRRVVNLAPADLRKEGPSFDLPIAIGMAICELEIDLPDVGSFLFAGELALNGDLRPIKGVLALAVAAKQAGKKAIILPYENAAEASLITGIEVYGAESILEVWQHLNGEQAIERTQAKVDLSTPPSYPVDFCEVKGQAHVKRAIEVAAAGGHNILLSGPPGTGKSMIAQRIPTILPPLTESEAIETTKVYSVTGMTNRDSSFIKERPFRPPHHTISEAGLLGGGSIISPGEVSLAHNGVLFLDEFPEFKRSTLEVLRQPLEDGRVTISRASGTLTFPSQFMLVAAMNPCPCGFLGDVKTQCSCNPRQLESYQGRLSGPILDRIDIQVDVPRVDYKELRAETQEECSTTIRDRITRARQIQHERYSKEGMQGVCNANASSKVLQQYCKLNAESHSILERSMEKFGYSGRAHNRILKVARTIADLEEAEVISSTHLMEALQLRSRDRSTGAETNNPSIIPIKKAQTPAPIAHAI